jgi:hypothetical protein
MSEVGKVPAKLLEGVRIEFGFQDLLVWQLDRDSDPPLRKFAAIEL